MPWQVIDVLHPNRASVPKEELKEKIAKTYKVGALHACTRISMHTHQRARRGGAWPVRVEWWTTNGPRGRRRCWGCVPRACGRAFGVNGGDGISKGAGRLGMAET